MLTRIVQMPHSHFFREIRPYMGRLIADSSAQDGGTTEAALICQILFLKFASYSTKTTSVSFWMGCFGRGKELRQAAFFIKRVAPCLAAWFGGAAKSSNVDSAVLFEFVSGPLTRYMFALSPV